jgi:putative hemolysin
MVYSSYLSIKRLLPNSATGRFLAYLAPVIDRFVGLSALNKLYQQHQFQGLEKQAFSQKLLAILGVDIAGVEEFLAKIPDKGAGILVCNHPYGMIEGVILAYVLHQKRPDTKILANIGLSMISEIRDYFIFANPLKPKAALNTRALKQCFKHVKQGGILVVFPAGRVSFYQSDYQRIRDGEWNRMAVTIATQTQTPILPVFITGQNSPLFYRLGRIYYRFRLVMLARELLKLQQHTVGVVARQWLSPQLLTAFGSSTMQNDLTRLLCYFNDPQYQWQWPSSSVADTMKPLIAPSRADVIAQELAALPAHQKLVDYKQFSVYYAKQSQCPEVVREITRIRELVFRTLDEGSGESCDTDQFDQCYHHLFIVDREQHEIIGAYRFGLTDQLLAQGGSEALYLNQMFEFSSQFVNQTSPCMEMGRSFIVPQHQNSFYGLLLLWKGIGAFILQNPQYKTLYGTVSLSKLYQPQSVALIEKAFVKQAAHVKARHAFEAKLPPEVSDYLQQHELSLAQVSVLVRALEPDGKDVPILLKQYHKLGANFHCLGIDGQFNATPGLLLSVDLTQAPEKLLSLYLGKQYQHFLQYHQTV